MSLDISKSLFKKLGTYGHIFSSGAVRTVKATYLRIALDLIDSYANDAALNGLALDRDAEERAVELFAANILRAGELYLEGGDETPFIPSWNRVTSVYTDVFDDLLDAVTTDMRDYGAGSSNHNT